MRRTVLAFALLAVALAASMPIRAAQPPMPVTLAVPGRANATPSIASAGDFVAVAWGATRPGGGADVFVATSRDAGATFAEPVRVNAIDAEAKLGGELPPKVVIAPRPDHDPDLAVLWTARDGDRTAVRVARSTDGGRTFAAPVMAQAAGAAGSRGWGALVGDARGALHALWLDHRGMVVQAAPSGGTDAGHDMTASAGEKRDGVAMAQRSGLYFASLGDRGQTPISTATQERELVKGVCYCCKTALAIGPDGSIYAAWRHVYPGNLRDIAFTVSRDGGHTFAAPIRVSDDRWQLDGCPDDGPSMVVDEQGRVHIAWPTLVPGDDPAVALFYASTRDAKTFTARQRIPTLGSPKPGHVQLVDAGRGHLLVAWDEIRDGARVVAVRELQPRAPGAPVFGEARVLSPGETSAYPVLARTTRGVLAAWTSGAADRSVIAIGAVPAR